jgi:pimeloyl-ACP methyl ester carboxylesterase
LLISTIIIVRLAGLKAYQNGFQVIGIDFRGYGESDKAMIQILRHDKLSK